MKLKNKIFTAAICLAVMVALLSFSVSATAEGCVKLELVSLNEGVATVDATLTDLPEGKTVDYVQLVLTPAQDKQVTNVTTAVENLSVEYQVGEDGKITILAVPTASGVAMAEGTTLCALEISGVESGSTLDYSVSYILCFTDGTDTEGTQEISVADYVATVCENGNAVQSYASAADAIAACAEGQYVKLLKDQSVDVTLNGDLYIDLNGYSLTGTISGDYKVYGMDTTTDEYGTATGSFNCGVVPVKEFKTEITGEIRRYMAVETENGYTFNRFYMGITKTSLRPDVIGVGYKAMFLGSEAVQAQVASYGYSLQLGNFNPITRTKEGFQSGKEVTLRVQNYDVVNYGETKLYAQAVLVLNDGTVIESAEYEMTLKDLVESVNANIGDYTETQILAVKTMLAAYQLDWNIENIMK